MLIKTLIADADMDVLHLLHDLLEINFRDVKIERAMSLQSFWSKIPAAEGGASWNLVFVSVELFKEEPGNFMERINEINPGVADKVILMGYEADIANCGDDVRALPFLAKPFSLDAFEELVKGRDRAVA